MNTFASRGENALRSFVCESSYPQAASLHSLHLAECEKIIPSRNLCKSAKLKMACEQAKRKAERPVQCPSSRRRPVHSLIHSPVHRRCSVIRLGLFAPNGNERSTRFGHGSALKNSGKPRKCIGACSIARTAGTNLVDRCVAKILADTSLNPQTFYFTVSSSQFMICCSAIALSEAFLRVSASYQCLVKPRYRLSLFPVGLTAPPHAFTFRPAQERKFPK